MAIDTRDKRASAMQAGCEMDCIPPLPDGSLASEGDRIHTAYGYRGISAGAPPSFKVAWTLRHNVGDGFGGL
jgi:hypothetical protein